MNNSSAKSELLRTDAGVSLVEYAILVALIAVVSLSAVNYLGNSVQDTFENTRREGFAAAGGICNPAIEVCP